MEKCLIIIICSLIICSLPLCLHAQDRGIHFEDNLTWEQVKEKAKSEHKYIFVDCYSTWCAPCKLMEREVYIKDTVGGYMNDKFISIKLQMDTTKNDNTKVQVSYPTAHSMLKGYRITGFPTFLFFSSEGEIVHKGTGLKSVSSFIGLIEEAQNPDKQYYKLLENFRNHQLAYANMPDLANLAKALDENDIALQIASDYMRNYLDKLTEEKFYTSKNFHFMGSYYKMLRSTDKVFDAYYHHSAKVDSIMSDKDYAWRFANWIISDEEKINSIVIAAKNGGPAPNWKKISRTIKNKYGLYYAERCVLQNEVPWYKSKKDWKNYTKYLVQQVEKKGIENITPGVMGIVYLNNDALDIFKYSNNKKELLHALRWIEYAMKTDPKIAPTIMDTKADILYKLGRHNEAISLQEKVVVLEPKNINAQLILEGMRKGEPIWLTFKP